MNCTICKKKADITKGAVIPADPSGAPDERKALCGKCKPKELKGAQRWIDKGEVLNRRKESNPKGKTVNQRARDKDPMATAQPWVKRGGRIVPNEKFYEYYGGDKAEEPEFNRDPEFAQWAKKKYPQPK